MRKRDRKKKKFVENPKKLEKEIKLARALREAEDF